MHWLRILTPLAACALLASAAPRVQAQNQGDETLLEMQQAFRQADRKKLEQLLPAARGHVLEPWAAYWELKVRLDEATPQEVESFLQRYPGSYQQDRLRGDWLLLLGQRRDWGRFAEQYPALRMSDERELRCYALLIEHLGGAAPAPLAHELRSHWYALRDADDGCSHAAGEFYSARQLGAPDIWRKARLGMAANRPQVVRKAVEIVAPEALAQLEELLDAPGKYLRARASARGKTRQELALLALIRLARADPDAAARLLDDKWRVQLSPEQRNWAWGLIGKAAAQNLSDAALAYFAQVSRDADLSDDMLGWKARAALRAGRWKIVGKAIAAMAPEMRRDSAWQYWRARALLAGKPGEADRAQARQWLQEIAGANGFYEQLALEELGQRVTVPPSPPPPDAEEKAAARANPGLKRGLYAILLGLRSEGVREWNYSTNQHQSGGMPDRQLLAAADLACEYEVWDRCINTSERSKELIEIGQRYPTPFREALTERAHSLGIDPAYVYGLTRQESRFIVDARSRVGAAGLMQVMPATARWTARKMGLTNFSPEQMGERDTNIAIGTAYLKLALDGFAGSMPLAAAAYNAGPRRARSWRKGPLLEAAIWIENLPFAETRDYVKKVLANTTVYAALLSGQPQSLKSRLGSIGPGDASAPGLDKEMP